MADRVFDSSHQWNVYGSEGRTSLGGTFLRTWQSAKHQTDLILVNISIRSLWPDRSSDNPSFHNPPVDFTVVLSQVVVIRTRIEEFITDLERWIERTETLSVSLCPKPKDQNLVFRLRTPEPKEQRLEKTLFEIEYSGIAFPNGKWFFGVDQSCIRLLAGELRASLAQLGSGELA